MTAYWRSLRLFFVAAISVMLVAAAPQAAAPDHPILFVTQVPTPYDFTSVVSVFGNHRGDIDSAPRGGDLYIRYANGSLKNLTKTAGYGADGFQGANSIAVREPSVHWSGRKALFSMVIGAPAEQYQVTTHFWQIYEVTGLGQNETPVIRKIANQPADANNVSPIYGSDDRIIFTSDRARNGAAHLYPQLDEYEEAPTVTGIWSLDETSGDLRLLDHAPSGDFSPQLDSFGRIIFTRWDHLQRDQQADADAVDGATYGTFNYADESANAARLASRAEVFPEPRGERTDLLAGTNVEGHSFNQFFPWTVLEDGTGAETLNHIGRHELHSYFDRSFTDDNNVDEFIAGAITRFNPNSINNLLQMREDPRRPGTYFAIDAPEFATHAAGQVVSLTAPPPLPANQIAVQYITARSTAGFVDDGATPPADHSGLYRSPVPLSNGSLLAVHTSEKRQERNEGTRENPKSRYAFRLEMLEKSGSVWSATTRLTGGITKSVTWWDPDVMISYNGELWELDPVEVVARPRPPRAVETLPNIEASVFSEAGVAPSELQRYLEKHGLALIVSRDITTRDAADRQQPFNLKVFGSDKQSVATSGKVYEVKYMQLFQADQIRGLGGTTEPRRGRRVLAQPMHEPAAKNPPLPAAPPASVRIAADGSMAALVPARRAMSWQLTDANGTPVVHERYWVTFQPGEIRVCTSCHGLNTADQLGRSTPVNKPQALRDMLDYYKTSLRENGRKRPVKR